ncbi:hypothetical protein ACSMFT_19080 [Ectopseudomonas oleovorans]|uniref:hypothetical protein n=1 Tax=Ectopseudomonas oleovorans TaxID=301 RepID=UPI0011140759|nr:MULTISPECIES: hypothetical protein [Pseudomonas]
MTDAITIQNPRNRGGSTGHVLAKRSVTFTEIRSSIQGLAENDTNCGHFDRKCHFMWLNHANNCAHLTPK